MNHDPFTCHVLHIIASLQGGAAHHLFYLSQGLKDKGFTVEIAAPNDNPALFNKFIESGFTVHSIPMHNSFQFNLMRVIRGLTSKLNLDLIHVHGHRAAFLTRAACLFSSTALPLVYTVHGYHPPHYTNPASRLAVNFLEWLLLNQTSAYICVSQGTQQALTEALPGAHQKAYLVENAVPMNPFTSEERERFRQEGRGKYRIPEDSLVLGTVARLQWQKGIDRLLQAFSILSKDDSSMHLLIVGDGPERMKLRNLAEFLNIAEKVHFTGHCDDVRPWYATMNLYVLSSLWEGLPLTILEAWGADTPVVATDVTGSRDIIKDGENGYLAPHSINGLVDTIGRAIEDQNNWPIMAATAKENLEIMYTIPNMVERTVYVYEAVAESD